jgi:hypothetical protein
MEYAILKLDSATESIAGLVKQKILGPIPEFLFW